MSNQADEMTSRKVKPPTSAFSHCPICGSSSLIAVDIDVICTVCGWDSLEGHVNAGGMDFWGAKDGDKQQFAVAS